MVNQQGDTMKTTEQWRRRLTDAEMEGIRTAIDAAVIGTGEHRDPFVAAAVFVFSLGLAERDGITWEQFLADDDRKLRPWDYAIPSDQWGIIGQWVMEHRPGDLSKANGLLDWMNSGPSGYET